MSTRLLSLLAHSLLAAAGVLNLAGCGSADQTYAPVEKVIEVTPADNVRSFLEGVSESGVLDSGATLLKENIAAMKASSGVDTTELDKHADELLGMSNPAQIKAKASEMLKLLSPKN